MAQTYQRIASTRLGTNSSSVTLSGIPSSYTDLEILISARSTSAANYANAFVQFNGDTTSGNYSYVALRGFTSATPTYDGTGSSDVAMQMFIPGASNTTGGFSHSRIYVVDYVGATNKSGSYVSHAAVTNASTGSYMHATGAFYWVGTSAINSITFSGTTFLADSLFQIYGILKA